MTLQTLLEDTIRDFGAGDEYRVLSYSGRGMYGRECMAVMCDNDPDNLLEAAMDRAFQTLRENLMNGHDSGPDEQDHLGFINSQVNTIHQLVWDLTNYASDNMGRSGKVIYWTNVEFAPETLDEDVEGDSDE